MDANTYNVLIEALARRGAMPEMEETFEAMRNTPRLKTNVQTFNNLIVGYGKAASINKALEMLEEMKLKSIKPNSQTYINLIEACSANGRPELVEGKLKEMKDTYKITPDVTVYQAALETLLKYGEITRGVELLRKMKGEGLLTRSVLKTLLNTIPQDKIPQLAKDNFDSWKEKLNSSSESLTSAEMGEMDQFLESLL